jgi:hypothetical protein
VIHSTRYLAQAASTNYIITAVVTFRELQLPIFKVAVFEAGGRLQQNTPTQLLGKPPSVSVAKPIPIKRKRNRDQEKEGAQGRENHTDFEIFLLEDNPGREI